MQRCRQCAFPLEEGSRFCPQCATRIAEEGGVSPASEPLPQPDEPGELGDPSNETGRGSRDTESGGRNWLREVAAFGAIALVAFAYTRGTFDSLLVHVGLNHNDCYQNNLTGDIVCGEAAEWLGEAQENIKEMSEPTPAPSEPDDFTGPDFSFSGNGQKSLGDLTVSAESVLEWTNSGGVLGFIIDSKLFAEPELSVMSQAAAGETILEPGTYQNVTVHGESWTIEIHPRDTSE